MRRPGSPRDRGTATAEIAVALPALVFLVMAAVAVITVVTAQLRCIDAAREAARAAARGEAAAVARDIALQAAPAGSGVTLTATRDRVSVAVSARVRLLSRGPSLTVEGRAVAMPEPGIEGAAP
jgi:Flp pilus assembly protein TadG